MYTTDPQKKGTVRGELERWEAYITATGASKGQKLQNFSSSIIKQSFFKVALLRAMLCENLVWGSHEGATNTPVYNTMCRW